MTARRQIGGTSGAAGELRRRRMAAGRRGRRRSTTSTRPPARSRRWCRSPAQRRCARPSRRRGRRSPAGARCRRSKRARARAGAARGAANAGARSWWRWSAPTWARRWPTPTARSAAGSSRSSRRRRSRTCSRARRWRASRPGVDVETGPPAGRRRRRDHAVQLPGDDPALVPALRDRLRQHASCSSPPSRTRGRRR